VVYATLIWSNREIEIGLMFAGQMACEALNWVLKRYIKEERPRGMVPSMFLLSLRHVNKS
jgi:dolichyldiphosphatase